MGGTGQNPIPTSYKSAMKSEYKAQWLAAMKEEFSSLCKKKVWILLQLPAGRQAVPVRWKFNLKFNSNEDISRFKARLLGKKFMQVEVVDFIDAFSLVSKYSTVRMILALMASKS